METWRKIKSSIRRESSGPQPQSEEEAIQFAVDATIHDNEGQMRHLLSVCPMLTPTYTFGKAERSLLHVAASFGAVNIVRVLIHHGIDVDIQDAAGVTPTHLAARNGHKRCLRQLIEEYHADTRKVDSDGFTAVHWLAANGRTELLCYMLDLGHLVDWEDKQGQSALHVAAQSGHAPAVTSLIERGATVNKVDSLGKTPLFLACKYGQADCTSILIQHGATLTADV